MQREYIWFYLSPTAPIEQEQLEVAKQGLQLNREGLTILRELEGRRKNREVQAQQPARTLSEEQLQLLNEQLRKGPKGPIYVHFPGGDAEAQRFAKQFSMALSATGWTVRLYHDSTLVGGDHPVGLQFAVSRPQRGGPDAEIPPHGKFLLQALRDLGLEISWGLPWGRVPADVVHLTIGAKPQPR
jgi:hypothetical protein